MPNEDISSIVVIVGICVTIIGGIVAYLKFSARGIKRKMTPYFRRGNAKMTPLYARKDDPPVGDEPNPFLERE
jgi:hypothetical protein